MLTPFRSKMDRCWAERRNAFNFNGGVKLANWSRRSRGALSLHAGDAEPVVGGLQRSGRASYPVEGLLSGKSHAEPVRTVSRRPAMSSLYREVVWDEPVSALTVDFDPDEQTVTRSSRGARRRAM